MKVGPPGWREHVFSDRLDGFLGDPFMQSGGAARVTVALRSPRRRTEVEIILARMLRRQLDYDHAKKVRVWRRRKFRLQTRSAKSA